ncbi:C39 family peptidase [Bacillus altitudinis]|uniref:C39 family peptidase n=1 Tax=Bacillus altitudinis TaxID=293387 RepID=UPI0039BF8506
MFKKIIVLCLAVLVLSGITNHSDVSAASKKTKSYKESLTVSVNVANVRSGPTLKHKVIKQFKKGKKLTATKKKKNGKYTWYYVKINSKKKGWIANTVVTKKKSSSSVKKKGRALINAPLINQNPQLANGCEVTSLAMMLNYAGVNVSKMTLAKKIKKVPPRQNPNDGFVGNIYRHGKGGLGVYHKPVADLGKKYLGKRLVDITGKSFEASVEKQIKKKRPVWVMANVNFDRLPSYVWQTWYTKTGKVKITTKMHSVLVTGVDSKYVYFNDPLAVVKNRKVEKKAFKRAWEQMGKQAISYN